MADIYPYQIVKFVRKGKKKDGLDSTNIVPSSWVFSDTNGKCFTKFMPPPYSKKRLQELKGLVISLSDAPDDWPTFSVTLKSHAKTYEKAVKRLDRLKNEPLAYTTDSDIHPSEKVKQIISAFKSRGNSEKERYLKSVLDVPSFNISSDEDPQTSKSAVTRSSKRKQNSSDDFVGDEQAVDIQDPQTSKSAVTRSSKRKQNSSDDLVENEQAVYIPGPQIKLRSQSATFEVPKNKVNNNDPLVPDLEAIEISDPQSANSVGSNVVKERAINNDALALDLKHTEVPDRQTLATPEVVMDIAINNDALALDLERFAVPEPPVSIPVASVVIDKNNDQAKDPKALPRSGYDQLTTLYNDLLTQVKLISIRQEVLIAAVEGLSQAKAVVELVRPPTIADRYGITIPFKTYEEFKNFETQLKNDASCRDDFKSSLMILLDKENKLTMTARNILRNYVSRSLAMSFTITKQMPGKRILKDTHFLNCITDYLVQQNLQYKGNANITAAMVHTAIGSVLSNAKDWDGFRTKRGAEGAENDIVNAEVVLEDQLVAVQELALLPLEPVVDMVQERAVIVIQEPADAANAKD